MTPRLLAAIAALALPLSTAFALPAPITLSETSLGVAIPDNDPAGLARTLRLADVTPWDEGYLLTVSLEITPIGAGAFTGDYYAYLSHTTETEEQIALAILLNRPGRTEAMPSGYSDSGFDIQLSDSAPADIHTYRLETTGSTLIPLSTIPPFDGILTGPWQPDARLTDPYTVLESSPRDAFLAPLGLLNPNGTWTLFTADLAAGGLGQLDSWSVTLTPIPEPSPGPLALLALSLGTLAVRLRRRR